MIGIHIKVVNSPYKSLNGRTGIVLRKSVVSERKYAIRLDNSPFSFSIEPQYLEITEVFKVRCHKLCDTYADGTSVFQLGGNKYDRTRIY